MTHEQMIDKSVRRAAEIFGMVSVYQAFNDPIIYGVDCGYHVRRVVYEEFARLREVS